MRLFDIVKAWRKFRELFGDIDLGELIKALTDLWPLPSPDDEKVFRTWCVNFVEVGNSLADITSTEKDDELFEALGKIMETDQSWEGFYSLFMVLYGKRKQGLIDSSDSVRLSLNPEDVVKAEALSGVVGITVDKIVELIQTLIDIITGFFSRD